MAYGREYYAGNLIYIRKSREILMVNLVSGEQKVIEQQENGAGLMRYLTFALGKGPSGKTDAGAFRTRSASPVRR